MHCKPLVAAVHSAPISTLAIVVVAELPKAILIACRCLATVDVRLREA